MTKQCNYSSVYSYHIEKDIGFRQTDVFIVARLDLASSLNSATFFPPFLCKNGRKKTKQYCSPFTRRHGMPLRRANGNNELLTNFCGHCSTSKPHKSPGSMATTRVFVQEWRASVIQTRYGVRHRRNGEMEN